MDLSWVRRRSTVRSMNAEHSSDGLPGDEPPRNPVLKSARQQAILGILAESERALSTTDLCRITGQTLGATAHHVRTLVRKGFIAWAGERRVRGALQTFYVASEPGRLALRRPRIEALLTLAGAGGVAADGESWFTRLDAVAMDELRALAQGLKPELVAIAWRAEARRLEAL